LERGLIQRARELVAEVRRGRQLVAIAKYGRNPRRDRAELRLAADDVLRRAGSLERLVPSLRPPRVAVGVAADRPVLDLGFRRHRDLADRGHQLSLTISC